VRRVLFGGFAVTGAVSTVLWAVSLATAKHHRSIWELLALGLGCFLIAALVEVYACGRLIRRYEDRSDIIREFNAISQEGRDLLALLPATGEPKPEHMGKYEDWRKAAEPRISALDPGYAHEFAAPDMAHLGPREKLEARLTRLHDITRAARTGGSHIMASTDEPSLRLQRRFHALRRDKTR
jgi:hypothetical protein